MQSDDVKNIDETVLFHAPCTDGLMAATLYRKLWPSTTRKFVPIKVGSKHTLPASGKVIYLDIAPLAPVPKDTSAEAVVDFDTQDSALLMQLLNNPNITSVTIIDHHVTNEQRINTIVPKLTAEQTAKLTLNFSDNTESAALMVVSLYGEQNSSDLRLVRLDEIARYVDDRDRWIFTLPGSKAVSRYINTRHDMPGHEKDPTEYMDQIDAVIDDESLTPKRMAELGDKFDQAASAMTDIICEDAVITTMKVKDKQYRVAHVCTRMFRSEVGNQLITKYANVIDLSICWSYELASKEFWISMRSDDQHADVSKICQEFGGGGHRNAAGCAIKVPFHEVFDCTAMSNDKYMFNAMTSWMSRASQIGPAFQEYMTILATNAARGAHLATWNSYNGPYRIAHVCAGLLHDEISANVLNKFGDKIDFVMCWQYDPAEQMFTTLLRSDKKHLDLSVMGKGFTQTTGYLAITEENFFETMIHDATPGCSPPELCSS